MIFLFEYIVTLLVEKEGVVRNISMSGISDNQIEAEANARKACLDNGYYVMEVVNIEVYREVE